MEENQTQEKRTIRQLRRVPAVRRLKPAAPGQCKKDLIGIMRMGQILRRRRTVVQPVLCADTRRFQFCHLL